MKSIANSIKHNDHHPKFAEIKKNIRRLLSWYFYVLIIHMNIHMVFTKHHVGATDTTQRRSFLAPLMLARPLPSISTANFSNGYSLVAKTRQRGSQGESSGCSFFLPLLIHGHGSSDFVQVSNESLSEDSQFRRGRRPCKPKRH